MASTENRASARGSDSGHAIGNSESGGPDRVRQEVVEAASRLFAERGIHPVSVREIAREVGVSHTLIHLYFGSKEEIVVQVLAEYDDRFARQLEEAASVDSGVADTFKAMAQDFKFLRIVAAALVEGFVPHRVAFQSRALDVLNSRVADRTDEARFDPRVVSAMLASVTLGWALGGSWVAESMSLRDRDQSEIVDELANLLQHMLKSCI